MSIPINKRYNSQKMIETGCYQTSKFQNKEDWWLFAYLKEKYILKGLSAHEYIPLIKEEWIKIFKTRFIDCEKNLSESSSLIINSHFKKMVEKSNSVKLDPSPKRIVVYQSELDYINSIPAPKWFREFLLLFLSHCRATGRNKYEYAPIQEYIGYLSLKTRNRDLITDTIYKKLREFGLWSPVTVQRSVYDDGAVEKYDDVWFKFILPVKARGSIVFDTGSIFEIMNQLDVVSDKYKCDVCGKEFVLNNRTQRTICDECYKKHRRELWKQAKRKERMSTPL